MIKDPGLLEPFKPVNRDEAVAKSVRIPFESGEISGTISLAGGRLDDVKLTRYSKSMEDKAPVELLSPSGTKNARYIDYGWVGDSGLDLPTLKSEWQIKSGNEIKPGKPVVLVWDNGKGLQFEQEIALDEHFVFTITQRVKNGTDKPVSLHPYALISQMSIPKDYQGTWMVHEGPVGFIGESLYQRSYGAISQAREEVIEAQTGWIGISDKYWLTALIPQQGADAKYRFLHVPDPLKKEKDRYQLDYTGAAVDVAAGEEASSTHRLYTGAKKVLMLAAYQKSLDVRNLDLAVDFGWFWFFTYPFFLALHYLGQAVGTMGLAIIMQRFR
jgi:YidC/Oxa1 family membrane protein insertase